MQYLNKLLESKANGPEIALLLTTLLDVKISATTLTKEIEEHPDYPSLLSISDVLNGYGIENMGIKFDTDKFLEIPVPFITQLRGKKSTTNFFTIVKDFNGDNVRFFDPEKHKWGTLAKESFLKNCSGIALLAEAGGSAGEKDYIKIRRIEKRKNNIQYITALSIPAIVLIAGITAFMQYGSGVLLPFVFTLLTLAGGITGALLLWYEIDQHNPVLQQICGGGKKANCAAVLQSKASKIAGVSWSAIGFSYFMGMLLLLLFSGIGNPGVLFTVAWLNAVASPYILFSVYYQWRIAKQWCLLCLVTQALLALQLITVFAGGWHTLLPFSTITPGLIVSVITALAVPFIVTAILIPALQKAKESKRVNTELQKLKHNRQIFAALLQKQKEITENPEGLGITLGNPNAAYKLIKVCNPYCGPCAKAHTPMEELLHNNPEIQVQILFTASNKEGDIQAPPVKHLLAIAEKNRESIVKQALDDWYLAENKNYEAFTSKYPMNGELKQQNDKIEAMREWCNKTGIEFTPTFFVSLPETNNEKTTRYYQLPDVYSVADLKYFFSV
ncbi:Protein-disulfide isomerase [Mucilaginibacter sp. OK268]|uniref:vitamin K epoxide reductase family protein n=1 Tax=Mucilaginibacter sp. OK268 TaxID=1881048 RepID=UPI000888A135|nr:vitamin K epoxide reductase family protein [Mucilaginibacter sp. OK268]SDP99827.1 Protein-disulfide isomerase [Mucilaginibacter sp. OK268]